jgi:hypothetical protein
MCPRCGSEAVEPRERCDHGLQRCNGGPCAARLGPQVAMCTDWTRAICADSKWRPRAWGLGIGVWPLQLNATAMAAAADIQERTAPRGIHLLAGGIYETSHREPTRHLEPPGEADACSQRAGSQGLPREGERHARASRPRGLQLRGRATAETGRPPMRGWVQRRDQTAPAAPAAPVYLDVLEQVRTAPLTPILVATVKGGAQFCTDAYNIYHFTAAA